jgi:hypothetical protein
MIGPARAEGAANYAIICNDPATEYFAYCIQNVQYKFFPESTGFLPGMPASRLSLWFVPGFVCVALSLQSQKWSHRDFVSLY